jgi:MFS transporter, FHS family, L-fucose permease
MTRHAGFDPRGSNGAFRLQGAGEGGVLRKLPVLQAASGFTAAFVLTVSLFAVWGLGHRLYQTLVPQFALTFHLHGLQLALFPQVYNFVYIFGAIPAALYARRFGSKAAILLGLGCIGVGAYTLYPAAEMHAFGYLLTAVSILACGWILLEVAANPLAACLGPSRGFVWRLNFAQAFYPVGALAGVMIGRWLVDSDLTMPSARFAYSIAHPYILIAAGVLLLAFLVEEVRFPPVASERCRGGGFAAIGQLLRRPKFTIAIVAQFCSVLALVGIWSVAAAMIADAFPHRPDGLLGDGFVWALIFFAAGRFIGTALMRTIAPARLLALFAGFGAAFTVLAAATGGFGTAIALLGASFCVSITWPTILGLAIRDTGLAMKPATALIAMGGALGGVSQHLLGVWAFSSPQASLLLPALGFAGVLVFALIHHRGEAPGDACV